MYRRTVQERDDASGDSVRTGEDGSLPPVPIEDQASRTGGGPATAYRRAARALPSMSPATFC
nr:hypothetical protein OG461_19765 [Streptomyces sp. NBC_00995]